MLRITLLVACFIIASFAPLHSLGQNGGNSELQLFGYFQNTFRHESSFRTNRLTGVETASRANTFLVQQLNLFGRRELGQNRRWLVQLNLELLNSYSSFLRTGSLNLEEAWVLYRGSRQFNLKLGLQIPRFNALNEIKNRTPLLPYIVRPLVYESSFKEFIAVEEYVPQRGFVQAYGQFAGSRLKFDYAFYLGNTSSLLTFDNLLVANTAQTGVDTTDAMLFGFRFGARLSEWQLGFSATFDEVNDLIGLEPLVGGQANAFEGVPRTRVGFDIRYEGRWWWFDAEGIRVQYNVPVEEFEFDRTFGYATLGVLLRDVVQAYASYWVTQDELLPNGWRQRIRVYVPTLGMAYTFPYNITIKAQYAYAIIDAKNDIPGIPLFDDRSTVNNYSLAISVVF